jgi:hypothetical protein
LSRWWSLGARDFLEMEASPPSVMNACQRMCLLSAQMHLYAVETIMALLYSQVRWLFGLTHRPFSSLVNTLSVNRMKILMFRQEREHTSGLNAMKDESISVLSCVLRYADEHCTIVFFVNKKDAFANSKSMLNFLFGHVKL